MSRYLTEEQLYAEKDAAILRIQTMEGLKDNQGRSVLEGYFEQMLTMALNMANRLEKETEMSLIFIAEEATRKLWERRGEEGSTSLSLGAQSHNYSDIQQAMMRSILNQNLRYLSC